MAKGEGSLSMVILSFVGLIVLFSVIGVLMLISQGLIEFSKLEIDPKAKVNEQQKSFKIESQLVTQDVEDGEERKGNLYDVVSVVDGDTIVVLINGVREKVRLLGINTPETVDPKVKPQCFGKEASEAMKNLVENKKVELVSDNTQGDADRYGRLLRYVYLESGENVNEYMISNGFAFEYTYNKKYLMRDVFLEDQASAKMFRRGLWSLQTCDGKL